MNSIQDNNIRITPKTSEKPVHQNNRISDEIIAYFHDHEIGDKNKKKGKIEKENEEKNKVMKNRLRNIHTKRDQSRQNTHEKSVFTKGSTIEMNLIDCYKHIRT